MSEETVYICDKLAELSDVKPATRPCRRAVNEQSDIEVELTIEGEGVGHTEHNVKFCSPAHANFWLSRQRVS